jgi:hypothetical protein
MVTGQQRSELLPAALVLPLLLAIGPHRHYAWGGVIPARGAGDDGPATAAPAQPLPPPQRDRHLGPGRGPWEAATPESQGLSTEALRLAEERVNDEMGGDRLCFVVVKNVRPAAGSLQATSTHPSTQ